MRFVLYLSVFLVGATCSIPNLESTQCSEARDDLKRFYSFHFANDMNPSPDGLEARKRFLTEELYAKLEPMVLKSATDYFTQSDEPPRTFRVAECDHFPDAGNLWMRVQLFWRDSERTTQREIKVDMRHRDGWLIEEVVTSN